MNTELKYSIAPMEKQNAGWSQCNGPESSWCWIQIEYSDGVGFGCTKMGPYRRLEAELYIKRKLYPEPKGFWRRLFSK